MASIAQGRATFRLGNASLCGSDFSRFASIGLHGFGVKIKNRETMWKRCGWLFISFSTFNKNLEHFVYLLVVPSPVTVADGGSQADIKRRIVSTSSVMSPR